MGGNPMFEDVKLRARRCPKCGKYPDVIYEHFSATTTYDILDHGLLDTMGQPDPGFPEGLSAECGCGHRWNLRGIEQIDGLEVE